MNKQDIINAWAIIRKTDQTIPDDVLDFMKDAAIERLMNSKLINEREIQKKFYEECTQNTYPERRFTKGAKAMFEWFRPYLRLNKEQSVQECDTTKDDSSNPA